MTLEPGLQAAFRYTVTEADTAAAIGSGEVPVLATPRVLALAEQATVAAVAGALQAGATTVGTRGEGAVAGSPGGPAPAQAGPRGRGPRAAPSGGDHGWARVRLDQSAPSLVG